MATIELSHPLAIVCKSWCLEGAAEIATTFFTDMEARWGALVGSHRLQDVKSALTQILVASPSHGARTPNRSAP